MKIEKIMEMVDDDLKYDQNNLDTESLKSPLLHNKYLKLLAGEILLFKRLEQEKKRMYMKKYNYYMGRGDPDDYENWPDYEIGKAEIKIYIESDAEYQEIEFKMQIEKEKIEYLEKIIKTISSRNWDIRNAIEWQKFQNGVI